MATPTARRLVSLAGAGSVASQSLRTADAQALGARAVRRMMSAPRVTSPSCL